MSLHPTLQQKRTQIFLSSVFVLIAAIASMLVGLALAQRLRAPPRAAMGALRQIRQGEYAAARDIDGADALQVFAAAVELVEPLA
jgi:hypothetical protein